MSGPLSGITVLDISSVVAGPLATMYLADQGANVIKVEPPSGDINRRSRQKVSENGQFSALFISTNHGKRSIALDLKNPEAMAAFRQLLLKADVLVQNFRPGATEKLGIGWEDVHKINPRTIYVSISGVGDSGPYVRKRIYDPMIQALSGMADIQSDQNTRRPQMIRTILADKTTSIFTAQAITAALFAREKTGVGQHIKLSLLGTMLSFLWPEAMMQYTVVGRERTAAATNVGPDLVFETRDGFMTVGTISDAEWQGFCDAVERPELKQDERFATAELRNLNSTERINIMAAILREGDRNEWLRRLDLGDVPCAPVLRRDEIIENEQVVAMNLVQTLEQPFVGEVRQPAPAALFNDTPSTIGGPAPGIGEHTREILSEAGLSASKIEELIASGAARTS
ncbi:CaiB/BaiF CoA transferase family protein [Paraburkholderia xenovorans]|uniref:CaiB/BaiF CoA transferase family protein n=1 Tax=Paraburkholderia xenovorans TaxID=36873 RepID=UPI0038BCDE58